MIMSYTSLTNVFGFIEGITLDILKISKLTGIIDIAIVYWVYNDVEIITLLNYSC